MKPMFFRPRRALIALLLLAACSREAPVDTPAPEVVPASVFVATPPSGAIDVRAALDRAKVGDELVVHGFVGGRKKPFVEGRAVLVLIDPSLEHCPDEEGCPTPWDYCCETSETLLANTLTVQIVGADGAPLAASLDGVRGLAPLAELVVAGVVRRTEGSVVLDAKQIHVAGG